MHELNPVQVHVAVRAANEGIPVAAIARIIDEPFDVAHNILTSALSTAEIVEMPKNDWPPTAKRSDRLPTSPRIANAEDLEFVCQKEFKLTNLEAGFITVLLRNQWADKEKLHGVVERQRASRYQKPEQSELTDPKIVDVIMCKLRKKLRTADPAIVVTTAWGKGYYFEPVVKQRVYDRIGGPYADGHGPAPERAPAARSH